MLDDDFQDLRLGILKYFSSPHSIEEGCDYISKITTRTENMPEVKFQLCGSDGKGKKHEITIRSGVPPAEAFDIIERRIRLSSLHFLNISGEIEAFNAENVPRLNEGALIQMQEARASILFLHTKKNREHKDIEETKLLEDQINNSSKDWLFESKPFDASMFTKLDDMESRLK